MMQDNKNSRHEDDYSSLETQEFKRKSNAPLIIAIIAASAVVLAAAGFFAYALFFNENSVISHKDTTTAPPATVAESTQPTVTVTENKISELLIMPDLTGLNESDAYKKLNSEGIKFKVTREFSDSVALNHIISQNPAANASISASDEAVIYISRGKENEIVTSPAATSGEKATSKPESSSGSSSAASSGDYVLADSSSRKLSKNELSALSEHELEIALNEIYARHGRIFKSAELSAYFNSKSWYHGTVSADKFSESVFNTYELYNIGLITSYMAEKGYR